MLAGLFFMITILFFSLIPDVEDSGGFLAFLSPPVQNYLHLPVYGMLAMIWYFALKARSDDSARCFTWSFVFTVSFGIFCELCQLAVPGRMASGKDLLFDGAGILLGLGLSRTLEGLFFQIRKKVLSV